MFQFVFCCCSYFERRQNIYVNFLNKFVLLKNITLFEKNRYRKQKEQNTVKHEQNWVSGRLFLHYILLPARPRPPSLIINLNEYKHLIQVSYIIYTFIFSELVRRLHIARKNCIIAIKSWNITFCVFFLVFIKKNWSVHC